jgi:Uma2 family endonuclease
MRGQPQRHYTADDYFAIEADSAIKHEYDDGEIFAMAEVSLEHNEIAANVLATLRTDLIEQAHVLVEHHQRGQRGAWRSRSCRRLDAAVPLTSVSLSLPLGEIDREVFE